MERRSASAADLQSLAQEATSSSVYATWAFGSLSSPEAEVEELQRTLEEQMICDSTASSMHKLFRLGDALPLIREGVQVVVDDEFTRCFAENAQHRWNWNIYLFPAWLLGVAVRYGLLLPLRMLCLLLCTFVFAVAFATLMFFVKAAEMRQRLQLRLIRFWANVFVASWSGVIKYHGVLPKRAANQIFVANHSSMIDVIILDAHRPYATVGQQHPGLVGFIQSRVLQCLGCLWFDRNETKDREIVARKIREHIADAGNNPLLIFPEGTCVNNRYCMMFKRGAFDIGAKVCPIAIKYNKEYCDPFWNSKRMSFWRHLFTLMTSWAVVCDVYYLEPQTIGEDENPTQFANRVKEMIARKAGLVCVPWDGYLKHLRPSARFMEHRQKLFAASMLRRFPEHRTSSPLPADDSNDKDELRQRVRFTAAATNESK